MDPSARNPAVPPELPPRMFSVPDKQTVVPGVRPPEARSDLVELARMVNDHVCASMGVPASVVFEGKFSSNSMSQLQLCAAHVCCAHIRVLSACSFVAGSTRPSRRCRCTSTASSRRLTMPGAARASQS